MSAVEENIVPCILSSPENWLLTVQITYYALSPLFMQFPHQWLIVRVLTLCVVGPEFEFSAG